ncbi:uncharacterized protein LOC113315596 [Papaver somniferum]|uniref:uncharacterized protein LOC113315596 n=1 Tax=Papaver somniferum TaxID=3469 RepID=UPI000E70503E|nr:uncharacterized protein LOC113315596 [Papaver somniferum]
MATIMQQNTQNINTIADTVTRNMASLLLARFPLNTGLNGNNGNIGTPGSSGSGGTNGMPGSSGSGGNNGILGSPIPNNLKWVHNKLTNPTWLHFCSLVRERFADKKFSNPRLALSTISQQGSVRDHIREFEQLINFVTDVPDDYIIDIFIRSIKKEIRYVVEVFEPPTLAAAFMKSIKQEDVLLSHSSFYKSVARSNPYRQSSHSSGTSSDNTANAPFKKTTIPSGVKRLSLEEQRHRCEQGLCFNCEEQYKADHICAKPLTSILLILEMAPEKNSEGDEETKTSDTEEMITPAAANQMHYEPTISLHALTGSSFPNTMRVTGYIAGQPLTILLDSGSTHNFLHPTIAKRCDYQFTTEFFLLELSGCEAVLGVQWLRTLVTHSPASEDNSQVNTAVSDLLLRFSDLFASPTDLPPQREHDHLRKKDGSWRMCVDYRALNKATVKYRFPIPIVDELLDELHGAIIFSKIDMRSGYHQIRVHPDDIHKTAFRTHDGHYEFLVMAFGLSNATATFQSLMNEILRPYLRKFVLVFFDDILIYSKSESEHIQHVKLVCEALRAHQIFLKQQKCEFAKETISYLGHMVSSEGVSVDSDKIYCITNWPLPTTVKALRGFLGLDGYYRKFVKDYGNISAPLTQLLKLDAFVWTPEATTAFNKLKKALTSTPVLALPDFTKEFSLECDASGNGLGAVLIQDKRPIAYYSKSLSGKNLNLSVYAKEMLVIVTAVNKCQSYLLGRHFKIYIDHRSLKYFLEQRISSMEQQKWLSKLLGYDYEII